MISSFGRCKNKLWDQLNQNRLGHVRMASKSKPDLLGQVSRLRKREEQIPPLEWVGPEVR